MRCSATRATTVSTTPRISAAYFTAVGEEVKRESTVTSAFSPAAVAAAVLSGVSVISE